MMGVKFPTRLASLILVAWAALLAANSASAQRNKLSPNDPATDPYTGGDPERMAAAGIVSLGGFEFGKTDTAEIDAYLVNADIRWVETAHFKVGMGLPDYSVPQKEKKKILAELEAMSLLYPEISPKVKRLEPWLRAHMFAWRCERLWDRMLEVLQVSEADFPDGSIGWNGVGPYMGEGPYLGQKNKYEVLLLPTEFLHTSFLRNYLGLVTKKPQRWNIIDRDAILVAIHSQEGHLKRDEAMHGALAFNLAHNLLDGYKHYSYDTPVWFHEGLGHALEREITPNYNSFDSSEGGVADMTNSSKWTRDVQKLVRAQEAPRLAELMSKKTYAELDLDDHFTTWSMVVYLLEQHQAGFACLLGRVCGGGTSDGDTVQILDGSNLASRHREAFSDCLGMNYTEFDLAWRDWVMGVEPEADDDVEF